MADSKQEKTMRNFLRWLFNTSTALLPVKLRTKLRLLIHIATEPWQMIPPSFPHSGNFAGKIPDNWRELLSGTDERSICEVAEFFRRIKTDLLAWQNKSRLCILATSDFAKANLLFPPHSEELENARKKYHLSGEFESLVAHHGAAFLPENIRAGFRGKAIIDAGAYVGNYVIPYILNYAPEVVYAVEPNRKSIEQLRKNLAANHIPENKCEIFNCAVGAENKEISFDDSGIRMDVPGNCKVTMRKLDDLLLEKHIPVGLIKADVEGMGCEMLAGAVELIKRDRPVLALSCYHTPEELFGQYEFIKENFPFYRVSFTALPPGTGWELTMTAVPEVQP